jgi:DNA-binding MarR family transcriptional regulator
VDTLAGLEATRGCYCLTARKAARALTRLYEERLRPHGLRATQFSVLAALAVKGPTRVVELAEMLGLERTTLTRSVALLQRDGWTSTVRSDDHRERVLGITDEGLRKLESALPAWQQAQEIAGRTFSAATLDL